MRINQIFMAMKLTKFSWLLICCFHGSVIAMIYAEL